MCARPNDAFYLLTFPSSVFTVYATHYLAEITIGAVLGRGGFCTVSTISKVTLKDGGSVAKAAAHHDDDDEDEQHGFAGGQAVMQDRNFIAQKYLVSWIILHLLSRRYMQPASRCVDMMILDLNMYVCMYACMSSCHLDKRNSQLRISN